MGSNPGALDRLLLSGCQLGSHLLLLGRGLLDLDVQLRQLLNPPRSFLGPPGLQLVPGVHQGSAHQAVLLRGVQSRTGWPWIATGVLAANP